MSDEKFNNIEPFTYTINDININIGCEVYVPLHVYFDTAFVLLDWCISPSQDYDNLFIQLVDEKVGRNLFSDYIPLNVFALGSGYLKADKKDLILKPYFLYPAVTLGIKIKNKSLNKHMLSISFDGYRVFGNTSYYKSKFDTFFDIGLGVTKEGFLKEIKNGW
jgi:hypothetical protein